AVVVAGCVAFPLFVAVAGMVTASMMQNWNTKNPGLMDLSQLLSFRSFVFGRGTANRGPNERQCAIYVATHYGSLITNKTMWNSPIALAVIKGDSRKFAEQSVADHPAPTQEEIADSEKAMKPYARQITYSSALNRPGIQWLVADASLVMFVGLP